MPVIKHLDSRSVDQTVAKFNGVAQQTEQEAKKEHGSRQYAGTPKFDKHSADYGRPLVGTKSQARGVRGGEHVMREIIFLCEMIEQNGTGTPPDCYIKFGPLFYMYSRISETLVGMLIRARKYGLLHFEGEMLYQRQDDHKHIRLLMSAPDIQRSIEYTGDPVNIIKFNSALTAPKVPAAIEAPPPATPKVPPATKPKPATSANTATTEKQASATAKAQPAATVAAPAATKAQPAATVTTPTATKAQPAATVTTPTATKAQPAATVTTTPTATKAQPAATTAPSATTEPSKTPKRTMPTKKESTTKMPPMTFCC